MKCELFRAPLGDFLVKVHFEDMINFDSETLMWLPNEDEIREIYEAIMTSISFNKMRKNGRIIEYSENTELT